MYFFLCHLYLAEPAPNIETNCRLKLTFQKYTHIQEASDKSTAPNTTLDANRLGFNKCNTHYVKINFCAFLNNREP